MDKISSFHKVDKYFKFSDLNEENEKELIEGTPFKNKWEYLDCFMTKYEIDEKKIKQYNYFRMIYIFFVLIQILYLLSPDFLEPIRYIFIYYYLNPIWGFIVWFPFLVSIGFIHEWVKEKQKKLKYLLPLVKINKNDWLNHRTNKKMTREMINFLNKWN
jgi:hypothetical protein